MTWRGVDDPRLDLDELIEGYFRDERILAADVETRVGPVPVNARMPGYDGRLFDWLVEMLAYGPPDGPELAWPVILQLIARAPDNQALTFVGCGAVEDLVNGHGIHFRDRIIAQATSDPRFRGALRHVWPRDDVSDALKDLIVTSRLTDDE